MKPRNLVVGMLLCGMVFMGSILAEDKPLENGEDVHQPQIQIALLLDTSGSMSGLINQAKTQLWKIVNEFALAEREGKKPVLQVALYEYGNTGLLEENGWIRQILPLTDNLDKVSEELFSLTTNGGDEYCGQVIRTATDNLAWSDNPNNLKTIFIAGNEPFTQGDVDYTVVCPAAVQKGITVNTIFCGPYDKGVETKWKDGALLADGSYMNIDHNQQVAHIEAPQDAEIIKLGLQLNKTYVAYGAEGEVGYARQSEQDTNALKSAPGTILQRSVSKAMQSKNAAVYDNRDWDLVDAVNTNKIELAEVKAEELPEELKKMTLEERQEYIEKQTAERKEIQEKINQLNDERKKFVAEEMKKQAETGEKTLDQVMIESLHKQAGKLGYVFE